MKKTLIFFITICMLASYSLAICTNPYSGYELNTTTEFCAGTFGVSNITAYGAIFVRNSNINLTCNNTILVGNNQNFGIYISGVNNITVKGCTFVNYSYGMALYRSNFSVIRDNTFNNTPTRGIYSYQLQFSQIINNSFYPNGVIHIYDSGTQNIIANNTINIPASYDIRYGIKLEGNNNNSNITGNTIYGSGNNTPGVLDGAAIQVKDTSNYNRIFDNRLYDAQHNELLITGSYNEIYNNIMENSVHHYVDCGLSSIKPQGNNFYNNTITHNKTVSPFNENDATFYMLNCQNATVENNTVLYPVASVAGLRFIILSDNSTGIVKGNSVNFNAGICGQASYVARNWTLQNNVFNCSGFQVTQWPSDGSYLRLINNTLLGSQEFLSYRNDTNTTIEGSYPFNFTYAQSGKVVNNFTGQATFNFSGLSMKIISDNYFNVKKNNVLIASDILNYSSNVLSSDNYLIEDGGLDEVFVFYNESLFLNVPNITLNFDTYTNVSSWNINDSGIFLYNVSFATAGSRLCELNNLTFDTPNTSYDISEISCLNYSINVTDSELVFQTSNSSKNVNFIIYNSYDLLSNCTVYVNGVASGTTNNMLSEISYSININNTFLSNKYPLNISCVDAEGNTATSSTINVTFLNSNPAVSNFNVNFTGLNYLYLKWVNPTSGSGWSYTTILKNGVLVLNTTSASSYNVSGLTAGTQYNLSARSYDPYGNYNETTLTASTRTFPILNFSINRSSTDATIGVCNYSSNPANIHDGDFSTYGSAASVPSVCELIFNIPSTENLIKDNLTFKFKYSGSATTYTNTTLKFGDETFTLKFGVVETTPGWYTSYIHYINSTGTITLAGGAGDSTSLSSWNEAYDASLSADYYTSQELGILEITTLTGEQISTATIKNIQTSNSTTGTLPQYIAMLNGTQTLQIETTGNWNYTYNYTSSGNETTRVSGIYNTIINWYDISTNASINTPNCYYDYNTTNPIIRSSNNYYLSDGNYDIYCINFINQVQNITINKTPNIPLNLSTYIEVGNISIVNGICPEHDMALHFDVYEEDNLTRVTATSIKYNLNFYTTPSRNFTFYGTLQNTNNFSLCIDSSTFPSWTVKNGEIQYKASGYVDRTYYLFQNTRLTDETTNISLYELPSSSSTTFQIIAETQTAHLPYTSKYLSLIRWYPDTNSYSVVDMGLTDNNGNTIIHSKVEEVDYRFALYELNGTLIVLKDPIRMVCLTTPCQYTITIANEETDYDNLLNLQYSLTYNETTHTWTLEYNDPSQATDNINLTIYRIQGDSEIEVCNNNVNAYTGAITCTNPPYTTGTLTAIIARSASPQVMIGTKTINLETTPFRSTWGLFLTFLIAIPITFALSFLGPVMAVIGVVLSIFVAYILGSITYLILAGIAIMAAITLHFINKAQGRY